METSQTAAWLALISALAALVYGLLLVSRPPSLLRTVVKTTAVAALALLAWVEGGAPLLIAALALSALGDAFMADPDRFLTPGLGSFLLAHVVYVILFFPYAFVVGPGLDPLRMLALAATVIVAGGLLRWLWSGLGKMKAPVIAYVAAIGAMVTTSLLMDRALWPAMVGAVAFMASDAILAGQLFRSAKVAGSQRLTDLAVWFLYYGAQAGIAYAFLR
jgi:uncharacterized membrane protein YhhN